MRSINIQFDDNGRLVVLSVNGEHFEEVQQFDFRYIGKEFIGSLVLSDFDENWEAVERLGTSLTGLSIAISTKSSRPEPLTEASWKDRVTLSGNPPEPGYKGPAPAPIDPTTGMHKDYWVLSSEERARGFVRPLRKTYRHLACGALTTMSDSIAQTYARNPYFYNATYCTRCMRHFPVGKDGEFIWPDESKVGT